MRIITVRNIERIAGLAASPKSGRSEGITKKILADVKRNGDGAVKKYEAKFGAKIGALRVSQQEIKRAYYKVPPTELRAVRAAWRRLRRAEAALKSSLKGVTVDSGDVRMSRRFSPIDSVGCYVPGGLARYPSSAIMSVTPAEVAGVRRIVVASPPGADGRIDPLTLVAADMCGATEVYRTGGVQAIAAMAFGTASINPVDKIVGPGGRFVTIAKAHISHSTAIDMLAGPTELGVIADSSADARYVAADIIAQAEHGPDTRCYAITDSAAKAKEIDRTVNEMVKNAARGNIIRASLKKNGFIAVCKSRSEMAKLAERLAPEHLEVIAKNAHTLADKIRSPGLVLVGRHTPSPASDYLLGANHILPTSGFGKTRGSLSVLDFMKLGTQLTTTRRGLEKIAGHARALTSAEGLDSHYSALEERL